MLHLRKYFYNNVSNINALCNFIIIRLLRGVICINGILLNEKLYNVYYSFFINTKKEYIYIYLDIILYHILSIVIKRTYSSHKIHIEHQDIH